MRSASRVRRRRRAVSIEIVDIAYYLNRGRLQLKNTIYGALRASGPMPGDSPDVVMKLYAVSPQGLGGHRSHGERHQGLVLTP